MHPNTILIMTKLGIYPQKIQVEMWFYNEEQTLNFLKYECECKEL
jgi:hypothetical protein